MVKLNKKTIIPIVLVILAVVLILIFRGKEHKGEVEKVRTVKAETFTVTPQEAIDAESFSGRFEAKDLAVLSTKVAGFVTSVNVKEGDFVRKGTVLVTIDDREIRQNISSLSMNEESIKREIESLKAREEYARSNYNRYKKLLEENAVTQEEFERVRSEYLAVKNQISALESRARSIRDQKEAYVSLLSYTTIRAPFDGYVISKNVDPGTFVGPGTPIVTIASATKEYDFVVEVPEKYFALVSKLKDIPNYVDALQKVVLGKLHSTSPSVNPQTNSFQIKIRVTSEDIKTGMFGKLILPLDKSEKILIPESMIVSRGNIKAVYKVDSNRIVHFQIVRTGDFYVKTEIGLIPERTISGNQSKDKLIEITGGLSSGDVIVKNIDKVSEGDRLE